MYVGKTLFSQVMEFVPWTSFARIVLRHGGNSGARTLSCAEQLASIGRQAGLDVAQALAPGELRKGHGAELQLLR